MRPELDRWSPEQLRERLARQKRSWRIGTVVACVAVIALSVAMIVAGQNPLALVMMVPYVLVRTILPRFG